MRRPQLAARAPARIGAPAAQRLHTLAAEATTRAGEGVAIVLQSRRQLVEAQLERMLTAPLRISAVADNAHQVLAARPRQLAPRVSRRRHRVRAMRLPAATRAAARPRPPRAYRGAESKALHSLTHAKAKPRAGGVLHSQASRVAAPQSVRLVERTTTAADAIRAVVCARVCIYLVAAARHEPRPPGCRRLTPS